MCEKLERGLWVSGRDEEGPYVKRGDQWIGYDDPISVKIKTAFVRAMGLGGVSLWSLDLDDFQVINIINLFVILNKIFINFRIKYTIKKISKRKIHEGI